MKCPKCNFITFDYEDTCPKCQRDLKEERKKLNLPSYKPDPPDFLILLGDTAEEERMDEDEILLDFSSEDPTGFSEKEDKYVDAMEEAFNDIIGMEKNSQSSPMDDSEGEDISIALDEPEADLAEPEIDFLTDEPDVSEDEIVFDDGMIDIDIDLNEMEKKQADEKDDLYFDLESLDLVDEDAGDNMSKHPGK